MKNFSGITDNLDITTKKYVDDGLAEKANSSDLATVATSGSYNDLANKLTAGSNISISGNTISATVPTNYVTTDTEQTITSKKTFNGEVKFGSTENFQGYYIKRMIGRLSAGTAYNNLDSLYKDGTYHRMWRLRFPSDSNFWGKIKITLYGGYSSFNASGVMSKSITCNFNTSSLYNNVGCYDGLGVNVEQDFRISEAIWNSTANAWEVLIWQKNLSGNNSPAIMLECWTTNNTGYINAFNGIAAQPVELTQSTSYSAQRASSTGGTKTVEWTTLPVYENPLGEEIATVAMLEDKQDKITSSNKLSASLVSGLATVATSGSYNDLSNKPTINGVEITGTKTSTDLKLGEVTANGGFQAGSIASADTGGAIGSRASATTGGAIGSRASATTGGAAGQGANATHGGAVGNSASATTGGAIGSSASATAGGAAGQGANATHGGAVGNSASATDGGAVGSSAKATHGGAVGSSAKATFGGAVGYFASATDGGAVGQGAKVTTGFAGGFNAKAQYKADGTTEVRGAVAIGADAVAQANNAVQLSTGTNANEGSLQFRDYPLVDVNGKIPADRLPGAGTSLGGVKTGGDVTITDGVITVSDDSHNHVISNIDGLQTELGGKASGTHTHTITPSGSVSSTFTGAVMNSTGSFTPSGSVSKITHTPAGSVTISATASTSGNYTPEGTLSKPKVNISNSASSFLKGASLKASLASDTLTLSVDTSSSKALTSVAAMLDGAPTFTGTKVNISGSFSGTEFSVTPTFTGTAGTVNVSGTTTGSVSSSFTGTQSQTSTPV